MHHLFGFNQLQSCIIDRLIDESTCHIPLSIQAGHAVSASCACPLLETSNIHCYSWHCMDHHVITFVHDPLYDLQTLCLAHPTLHFCMLGAATTASSSLSHSHQKRLFTRFTIKLHEQCSCKHAMRRAVMLPAAMHAAKRCM